MHKRIRGGIAVGVAALLAVIAYLFVYFSYGIADVDGIDVAVALVIVCAVALAALMVYAWQRLRVHNDYLCKLNLTEDQLFNL